MLHNSVTPCRAHKRILHMNCTANKNTISPGLLPCHALLTCVTKCSLQVIWGTHLGCKKHCSPFVQWSRGYQLTQSKAAFAPRCPRLKAALDDGVSPTRTLESSLTKQTPAVWMHPAMPRFRFDTHESLQRILIRLSVQHCWFQEPPQCVRTKLCQSRPGVCLISSWIITRDHEQLMQHCPGCCCAGLQLVN